MANPFERGLTVPSFLGAAALATLCGSGTMAVVLVAASRDWEAAIALPSMTMLFSFYAFLFVLGGLSLFGLPVAGLFERHARAAWLWPVAIALGAAAGALLMALLSVVVDGGWPMEGGMTLGAVYGGWAGLWWCYVCKRRLGAQPVEAPDTDDPDAPEG